MLPLVFLSIALGIGLVAANPINAREDAPPECATILCAINSTCQIANGKPSCVPLLTGQGVTCGPNTCSGDTPVCCNKSCGICTATDGFCTQEICSTPEPKVKCGPKRCNSGEVCCNESCGICTKPGGACTQQFCGTTPPTNSTGPACGSTHCAVGDVCCNSSCGICTKPGGFCTEQYCGAPS